MTDDGAVGILLALESVISECWRILAARAQIVPKKAYIPRSSRPNVSNTMTKVG